MKKIEFKKKLKELSSKDMIELFIRNEIYLTDKQLDEVLKTSPGHGGANFNYRKKENKNDKNN